MEMNALAISGLCLILIQTGQGLVYTGVPTLPPGFDEKYNITADMHNINNIMLRLLRERRERNVTLTPEESIEYDEVLSSTEASYTTSTPLEDNIDWGEEESIEDNDILGSTEASYTTSTSFEDNIDWGEETLEDEYALTGTEAPYTVSTSWIDDYVWGDGEDFFTTTTTQEPTTSTPMEDTDWNTDDFGQDLESEEVVTSTEDPYTITTSWIDNFNSAEGEDFFITTTTQEPTTSTPMEDADEFGREVFFTTQEPTTSTPIEDEDWNADDFGLWQFTTTEPWWDENEVWQFTSTESPSWDEYEDEGILDNTGDDEFDDDEDYTYTYTTTSHWTYTGVGIGGAILLVIMSIIIIVLRCTAFGLRIRYRRMARTGNRAPSSGRTVAVATTTSRVIPVRGVGAMEAPPAYSPPKNQGKKSGKGANGVNNKDEGNHTTRQAETQSENAQLVRCVV